MFSLPPQSPPSRIARRIMSSCRHSLLCYLPLSFCSLVATILASLAVLPSITFLTPSDPSHSLSSCSLRCSSFNFSARRTRYNNLSFSYTAWYKGLRFAQLLDLVKRKQKRGHTLGAWELGNRSGYLNILQHLGKIWPSTGSTTLDEVR